MNPRCWVAIFGLATVGFGYETWHHVDVPSVVCPDSTEICPPGSASSKTCFPQYELGIDYTTTLDPNVPHVISILRTSKKPVTVTFTVTDSSVPSNVVVPSTTVTLKDLTAQQSDSATCQCTGDKYEGGVESIYPARYGEYCSNWDEASCPQLWEEPMYQTGPWCCQSWCYATDGCADALASSLIPGGYYSYAACSSQPKGENCEYQLPDPCKCLGDQGVVVTRYFTDEMRSLFPSDYGSYCKNWDEQTCDQTYDISTLDDWCCSNWCYVKEECSTALPSLNSDVSLWWSSLKCENDQYKISQCAYRPFVEADLTAIEKCKCLGDTVNASAYGLPELYGKHCGAHDAYECKKYNPGATEDLWCCQSWCWVDASCPDARPSVTWPGKFYSGLDCEEDEDVLVNCAYSAACRCTGDNSGIDTSLAIVPFVIPTDYGTSCKSWDAADCYDQWGPGSAEFNLWVMNGKNDWCCKSWCYVSEECPIAATSKLQAPPYLYAACKDMTLANRAYYDGSKDECKDIPANEVQPQGVMSNCGCLGISLLPESLPAGAPADYGSKCQAWDSQNCEAHYPNDMYDMWCCLPWCYVNSTCPNAKNSSIAPGYFYSEQYSDLTCDVNIEAESIRTCKYSDACACLGTNAQLPANFPVGPDDYGTKCSDWDSINCFKNWGADTDAWDNSTEATNDWCCKEWCYVSFACPIAWGPMDNGMSYTYEAACPPNGKSYNATADTCESRRLTAAEKDGTASTEESTDVVSDPDWQKPLDVYEVERLIERAIPDSDKWWTCRRRRITTCGSQCCCEDESPHCLDVLSRRANDSAIQVHGANPDVIEEDELELLWSLLPTRSRRGKGSNSGHNSGGGGSWFGGGSKGGKVMDSRRRTPSRPVGLTPRRRASMSNAASAANSPRRRARSTATVGITRRRTSISGERWTSPQTGQSAYGFTNRPQLMNNYGGTMPAQTTYGYSGYGAYPQYYRPQMAMYSPGHHHYHNGHHNHDNHYFDDDNSGFYGGGGYHNYHAMNHGVRRRSNARQEWCIVPSDCRAFPQGEFVECYRCNDECGYGGCQSTADCYSGIGCPYQTPKEVNRDDLMATGFLPMNFKSPLSVKIESISGEGFDKASICPQNGVESYKADLFVTLTSTDVLGDPTPAPPAATPGGGACPTYTTSFLVKTDTGEEYKDFQAKKQECLLTLVQIPCTTEGAKQNEPGGCTGEGEICVMTGDPVYYDPNNPRCELMCVCSGDYCAEKSGGLEAVCHKKGTSGSSRPAVAFLVFFSSALLLFRA